MDDINKIKSESEFFFVRKVSGDMAIEYEESNELC